MCTSALMGANVSPSLKKQGSYQLLRKTIYSVLQNSVPKLKCAVGTICIGDKNGIDRFAGESLNLTGCGTPETCSYVAIDADNYIEFFG